jgi:hypothetical protein
MTSGVYELKFSNGARYIGKSIDIYNRWKQHIDKMRKGTAAKNMQDAYNRYGVPEADIMLECHPDHIDIMEAVFIARHNPELNSDRPADPFPGVDIDWYIQNTDFLQNSTLRHMELLAQDEGKAKEAQEVINLFASKLDSMHALNRTLLAKRSAEEINSSAGARLKVVSKSVNILSTELIEAKDEIIILEEKLAYVSLPWWKKIFS